MKDKQNSIENSRQLFPEKGKFKNKDKSKVEESNELKHLPESIIHPEMPEENLKLEWVYGCR